MKSWKIINKLKINPSASSGEKLKIKDILKVLLNNRKIKTKQEIEMFLYPRLESMTLENVGIDKKQLRKAIGRIKKAIKNKEKIVVFGDYDVDGICGTAILWETLYSLGADVMPYIPHRIEEGYGLSIKGIQNVISVMPNLFRHIKSSRSKILNQVQDDNGESVGLIITVDNGIVANKAVEFANKEGIDVIITDHHVPSRKLPKAFSIVHTTKLCGAGVAWMLSKVILNLFQDLDSSGEKMLKQVQHDKDESRHLELVALATVADLVPLVDANRTFVKFGIEKLRETKRIGLLELFKESGLDQSAIGVYEIGHVIAPRVNAMGRLEEGIDSLRLLCTKNRERARLLALTLGITNRERQKLTLKTVEHAKSIVYSSSGAKRSREVLSEDSSRQARTIMRNLLFVAHESYQQGIIGLVAGKLVEEFYRPAIVVSIGKKFSKASARSIKGFNIIEFIRSSSEFLVDAGGHPMAAGFTVETAKLELLQRNLEDKALGLLDEDKLTRTLKIDCELPLFVIDSKLYQAIQKLTPFGMGNPEPTFVSSGVFIRDMRIVGNDRKHLKFRFSQESGIKNHESWGFEGIGFGMGERASEFQIGDKVDLAYVIDENVWNGNRRLQLKVKDLRK